MQYFGIPLRHLQRTTGQGLMISTKGCNSACTGDHSDGQPKAQRGRGNQRPRWAENKRVAENK